MKGYKHWDPKDRKFVINIDMTFNETFIFLPNISIKEMMDKTTVYIDRNTGTTDDAGSPRREDPSDVWRIILLKMMKM